MTSPTILVLLRNSSFPTSKKQKIKIHKSKFRKNKDLVFIH